MMKFMASSLVMMTWLLVSSVAFTTLPASQPSSRQMIQPNRPTSSSSSTTTKKITMNSSWKLYMSSSSPQPEKPTTFREAEVLGLRLMQEGKFEDALSVFKDGMKLPGSRPDVIRTKLLSGPSPVGGAIGGFESGAVLVLDEFELQAAHYNMACAHAQLGNMAEAVANLKLAFDNGFDNFATVRNDLDLKPLQECPEFEDLMQDYDSSQKGFNPFGLFNNKKK